MYIWASATSGSMVSETRIHLTTGWQNTVSLSFSYLTPYRSNDNTVLSTRLQQPKLLSASTFFASFPFLFTTWYKQLSWRRDDQQRQKWSPKIPRDTKTQIGPLVYHYHLWSTGNCFLLNVSDCEKFNWPIPWKPYHFYSINCSKSQIAILSVNVNFKWKPKTM